MSGARAFSMQNTEPFPAWDRVTHAQTLAEGPGPDALHSWGIGDYSTTALPRELAYLPRVDLRVWAGDTAWEQYIVDGMHTLLESAARIDDLDIGYTECNDGHIEDWFVDASLSNVSPQGNGLVAARLLVPFHRVVSTTQCGDCYCDGLWWTLIAVVADPAGAPIAFVHLGLESSDVTDGLADRVKTLVTGLSERVNERSRRADKYQP